MGKKLTLHKSNQLSYLVTLLTPFYLLEKKPFETQPIIVHTEGMAQYIKKNLSKNLGVIADIEFQKPGAFFWDIAQKCIPELENKTNFFQPEILTWKLVSLFLTESFASDYPIVYAELKNYLNKYQVAHYDLARELAILFNHYMIYRPQWIEAWSHNQLVENITDKDQIWQKDLWQYLKNESSTYHRVSVWDRLKQILKQESLPKEIQLPVNIHLFSITSLAPLYLELIDLLSNHIPVHLFILSPCQENWMHAKLEHPLLESLGHQGKDFFNILLDYSAAFEQDVYHTYQPQNQPLNLLQTIKNDILQLKTPTTIAANYYSVEQLHQDQSIEIHAAHNPVRELQILKNQLIHYINLHPSIKLEEIGVLSPNIEQYLPFLEGIFGSDAPDNIPLAYSVSDIKIKNKQPYYSAVESILNFISSRFEVKKVLDLLNNELIRKQFTITAYEVRQIVKILKKLNIRWGLNQQHRKNFSTDNDQFTWEKGLSNLQNLVNTEISDHVILNFDTFCLSFQTSHEDLETTKKKIKPIIQKFLIFSTQLKEIFLAWHDDALSFKKMTLSIQNWINLLKKTIFQMIKTNQETQAIQTNFFQQLNKLNQETNWAQFNHSIDFYTFKHLIHISTNLISSAGFLNQGITFASLMPMRTIPFKFMALIGLNDQVFPRKNIHLSFDLIQKNRQQGDLSRRDDDRYLFLETLISTQEKLYLSFLGHSLEKNEILNPSPLINELIDLVSEMTQISSKELYQNWIIQHPLQNFSLKYYVSTSPLINYRFDYLEAYQNEHSQNIFSYHFNPSKNFEPKLDFQELLIFWKNPIKYWLKKQLNINLPWIASEINFTEPFSLLTPSSKYSNLTSKLNENGQFIIQAFFRYFSKGKNLSLLKNDLKQLDYLPSGILSETWFAKLESKFNQLLNTYLPEQQQITVKELLSSKANTIEVNLTIKDIEIHAQLENIMNQQLMIFDYTNSLSLSEQIKLQAYLMHVLYSTQTSPKYSYLLSLDKLLYFKPIAQNEAKNILSQWIKFMKIGMDLPLPFFYQTSFKVADKIKSNSQDEIISNPYLIQLIYEQSDENKYFENQLLFWQQELIAQHPHFLQVIKELIIPIFNYYESIEV